MVILLGACSSVPPSNVKTNARVSPSSGITRDLMQLPEPRNRIAVAVYGFRDQTGQYKGSPDSPYSTQVTQGAGTLLVKALKDSGWYIPVEREGLQNVLTERRIIRAIEAPNEKGRPIIDLPNLLPASLIIEGGIVGYETNVRTGGKGANYLGIGLSTQYRVDQVTVGLRSIDIRSGQVLNTVSVTKTIFSYQFDTNVFKFVAYQKLLQTETGFTTNEPIQLAVREAIEAAVIHLTVQAVRDRVLELKDDRDWNNSIVQAYLAEGEADLAETGQLDSDEPIPMRKLTQEAQALTVVPLLPTTETPAPERSTPPQTPAATRSSPAPAIRTAPATSTSGTAPASAATPGASTPAARTPAAPVAAAGGAAPKPAAPPARPDPSRTAPQGTRSTEPPVKQSSRKDDIFSDYWQGK